MSILQPGARREMNESKARQLPSPPPPQARAMGIIQRRSVCLRKCVVGELSLLPPCLGIPSLTEVLWSLGDIFSQV